MPWMFRKDVKLGNEELHYLLDVTLAFIYAELPGVPIKRLDVEGFSP